jgi:hypothetical protein
LIASFQNVRILSTHQTLKYSAARAMSFPRGIGILPMGTWAGFRLVEHSSSERSPCYSSPVQPRGTLGLNVIYDIADHDRRLRFVLAHP